MSVNYHLVSNCDITSDARELYRTKNFDGVCNLTKNSSFTASIVANALKLPLLSGV